SMDAHLKKVDARMKLLTARLGEMSAKVDVAGAEANLEYRKGVESLRSQQEALQRKLEEVRSAGADKWETVKGGLQSAWSELELAFKKAAR
ncbi:MAG: coiled coil domain-containing protein, partial [Candidatus Methylomirabilis sp.]|nr:coiled coil domain-containing protein [Deltaproteobacteria bacterium]